MKKNKMILFGVLLFLIIFSIDSTQNVIADNQNTVDVNGDSTQIHLMAHNRVNYRFRQRTQLRINCSANLDLDISCDALNIGNKIFEIEINTIKDLKMNMTCTEEQAELGLLKGEIHQNRNRNRFRYQAGFVVALQVNGSIQAKLKLHIEDEYKHGTWAYYDEDSQTWIPVETVLEDGFLVTETNHFSTWTIINLEQDFTITWIIGLGIVSVLAITGLIIWKKKRK